MARQLTIPVPEAVTSHYVVACVDPPPDVRARVRRRLVRVPAGPLPRLAADLLGTSLLEIRGDRAAWSDFTTDLAAAAKADTAAGLRLDRATHHLVVASHAPPPAQPPHAQAARAVARLLAEVVDGLLYDARCARILPRRFRYEPEPARFRLADHWLSAFVGDAARGVGVRGGGGTGAAGAEHAARVETGGMHRFGLPDLALDGAAPARWRRPLNLLRGVAVRLLRDHWSWLRRHPDDSPRRIGTHLWVEPRDVWGYWASEPAFGRDQRVRVRLSYAPDQCPGAPPILEVGPPGGFSGSRRDWLDDVVAAAIPEVSGWPRDTAA